MSHVLICREMPGALPIVEFRCECTLPFGILSKEEISDPCNERLAGLIHCHRQHAKIQALLIREDQALLAAQKPTPTTILAAQYKEPL